MKTTPIKSHELDKHVRITALAKQYHYSITIWCNAVHEKKEATDTTLRGRTTENNVHMIRGNNNFRHDEADINIISEMLSMITSQEQEHSDHQ